MTTITEVLKKVAAGDVFEAGKMFKFSSEPLVWVVDEIEKADDGIDVILSLYYYDIFVKEESVFMEGV
jgi:hypothetical protein